MLTTEPVRAVLCAAAVLLLTACGGGPGHDPQRLGEIIADTVRTAARGGGPGLGVPDTAFDPAEYTCVPAASTPSTDPWRARAPRSVADGSVDLGVLAPDTTGTTPVTVSVTGPDGTTATTAVTAVAGEWVHVRYPDDFDGPGGPRDSEPPEGSGSSPAAGAHTVVWSDSGSGAPLTCDGFETV